MAFTQSLTHFFADPQDQYTFSHVFWAISIILSFLCLSEKAASTCTQSVGRAKLFRSRIHNRVFSDELRFKEVIACLE